MAERQGQLLEALAEMARELKDARLHTFRPLQLQGVTQGVTQGQDAAGRGGGSGGVAHSVGQMRAAIAGAEAARRPLHAGALAAAKAVGGF